MALTDDIYNTIYSSGETVSITTSGARVLLKTGTYAGWTVGAGVTSFRADIESNTTITSAATFNGTNAFLNCGKCVTFSGRTTFAATGGLFICKNGCEINGLFISGNQFSFNGGGFGTVCNGVTGSRAIEIDPGLDATICNTSVHDLPGGAGAGLPILVRSGANRSLIYNVKFIDSDTNAIETYSDFNNIINNIIVDADSYGISIAAGSDNNIIYGNNIKPASRGFSTNTDNSIFCANIDQSTSDLISGSDSIFSGNRSGNTYSGGTGDIVSNNEVGAF